MKKIILLLLTGLLLTSCAERHREPLVFSSTIEKESCKLCGENSDSDIEKFRGQDNVGIIDLNTFEVKCVELTRYDMNGQLIEESTGVFRMGGADFGETRIQLAYDVDNGYAHATIPRDHDKGIDPEALGSFLCEDCLNTFDSQAAYEELASQFGIISFETLEIDTLESHSPMFGSGNYIVICDYDEYNRISLYIIYRPVRYSEAGE